MSTAVSPEATSKAQQPGVATALSVGAVLAGIGAATFVGSAVIIDMEPREAWEHPVSVVGGVLGAAGALVLALALARWRSSLPTWAVLAVAAGFVFIAGVDWFQATGIRAISSQTTNEEYRDLMFGQPWVMVMLSAKVPLHVAGYLGLAIAGLRQRSIPRAAAILFLLAAVLSIWPPAAPAVILASIAFFAVSRSMSGAGVPQTS